MDKFSTGEILHSRKTDGIIRTIAVNSTGTLTAISGDDKKLRVVQVEGLVELSTREVPKRPTKLSFVSNDTTILLADKFGDLWSYPVSPSVEPSTSVSDENPSNGKLLLGHTSTLTDFALSPDEAFVITSDRDEHIRVSWYPQSYVIESFCHGSEKYVTSVHIPQCDADLLVSGGGDADLKIWKWRTGELIRSIDIRTETAKFVIRQPPAELTTQPTEKPMRGRKRVKTSEDVEAEVEPVKPPELIFAIQAIKSLGDQIVFALTGGSAICYCDVAGQKPVKTHDFGFPVLYFKLLDHATLVVLLEADETTSPIQFLHLDNQHTTFKSITKYDRLSQTIKEQVIHSAEEGDLTLLDLYGALVSLPKTFQDYEAQREDLELLGETELTKRALGRLKNHEKVKNVLAELG